MKKAADKLCVILKDFLFIGFSIQIILGLIWMVFHFVEVQAFACVEIGIYPLFVRMFGKSPQVLYLLQLGAAFGAARMLVRPLCPTGWFRMVWYALALLTFPMAMQCHLALTPNSFVCSLIFLEVGFCRKAAFMGDAVSVRTLARAGLCWLGLALLLPEYGWLGAVLPVLTLLIRLRTFRRRRRQLLYCCILLAAFGGIIGGIGSLIRAGETDGYRRTFWFSTASRTAWPTLWNDAKTWSEELQSAAGESVWEASFNPGNMDRILQPAIEDSAGVEQAQIYYREMTEIAWQLHWGVILRQMAWDVLSYAAPEAVLQRQLTGVGYDSGAGRNYEIMLMHHPVLTKYYVTYCCWWFWVFLGATVPLLLLFLATVEKRFSRRLLAFAAVVVLWMAATVLYYTLQGSGIADYKYTVAAAELWIVPVLSGIERNRKLPMTESVAE